MPHLGITPTGPRAATGLASGLLGANAAELPAANQCRAVAFSFAVAAALIGMFLATWPLAVLDGYEEQVVVTWGMVGNVVGVLGFTAGFLIRRGLALAPLLLTGSGLLLITTWLYTGRLDAVARLDTWLLALGVDLLPVLLNAAAAWMTVGRPSDVLAVGRVR